MLRTIAAVAGWRLAAVIKFVIQLYYDPQLKLPLLRTAVAVGDWRLAVGDCNAVYNTTRNCCCCCCCCAPPLQLAIVMKFITQPAIAVLPILRTTPLQLAVGG